MLVASLPMYDLPEVRPALDTLWAGIARHLKRARIKDVPPALAHDTPVDALWSDPALLLSQCCGYDIIHRYAGRLRPIATPRYDAPGCRGSDFVSLIVVAADSDAHAPADLRGTVCAINGPHSHSGMNALRALVAPFSRDGRFFSSVVESGSHLASLAAVARGEADIAAIDCVTHALLARHRPGALAGTRVLCQSEPAPGLPIVARIDHGAPFAERLRAALANAVNDPDLATARDDLLLGGVDVLPDAAYERIAELEQRAIAQGYPELR